MLRCAVVVLVSMCSWLVLVVVGAVSVLRMPRGASGAGTMVGVSVSVLSVIGMSRRDSEPLSRSGLSGPLRRSDVEWHLLTLTFLLLLFQAAVVAALAAATSYRRDGVIGQGDGVLKKLSEKTDAGRHATLMVDRLTGCPPALSSPDISPQVPVLNCTGVHI